MKLVPDTSVIIDGRITSMIESGEYEGAVVIIPEAVVSELESQANKGKEIGFNGLEELKKLVGFAEERRINIEYKGERPTLEQIRLASGGEIDAMIRAVAIDEQATFVTSDKVQAEVARAKGLSVKYLYPEREELKPLRLHDYFTEDTMSVHLMSDLPPTAKRGDIGRMRLEQIDSKPLSEWQLREMAHEIVERAKRDPDSFIEIERKGATVVQIGTIRIAIARPPFSDKIEITAVQPIADVSLDDYRLSEDLKERLAMKQRGILIAGEPGAGKSTFAAGVADFLQEYDYLVKTMESPRDLQVSPKVMQYTALDGKMANTADLLLLVRPDYTIYDEMRGTEDFEVFADMRLAGVGMIGVIHATRAVDALQRLIGRVELGMIPQVVDTVVFIHEGEVEKVYDVQFTVKVPHGMTEADLARPVIQVIDFESGDPEYEIYTYGEQVVVMPIVEQEKKPSWNLAEREIHKAMNRFTRSPIDVEMVSDDRAIVYVDENDIGRVLGKGGENIDRIEMGLGVHIDVRPFEEHESIGGLKVEETKRHIILNLQGHAGDTVDINVDGEFLFTATVGRRGDIKVTKGSDIAEELLRANKITVSPA